jgi:antitoxin component of MazEF toxin-antitoxin module
MVQTGSVEWMGRIHAIGAALGLILPKALRLKLGIQRGDYFAIVVYDDLLVMRRVQARMVLDHDEVPQEARPTLGTTK